VRRSIAVIVSVLVLFQLAVRAAGAVVGGELVDVTLQRYTVVIVSAKGRCTGVVLAQNIVLTAAHCTQNTTLLWIWGYPDWGALNNPPVLLSPVAESVLHPRYNSNERGSPDLALLRLAKPLPDRFLAASLGARMPNKGDSVIATGYGESAANDPSAGRVLRMVLLRISFSYGKGLSLASTRDEPASGGHGDSGGPVFTYHGLHTLVGIIVAGSGAETVAVPIAPNYLWIKETMEKLNPELTR
jgi:hypothetical protein